MGDLFIFGKSYQLLENAMDITVRRHSIISNNIANMDTIGYKPKDLDFKEALRFEMEKKGDHISKTHPKHLSTKKAGTIREEVRENHDSVNIDTEMISMVENNIKFRFVADRLAGKAKKWADVLSKVT